jgi:regulator of replication initiation timing
MSMKKADDEKVSNVPPFGLRMLPDLKERVAIHAMANGRSLNAEIVDRLQASFAPRALSDGDLKDTLDKLLEENKMLRTTVETMANQLNLQMADERKRMSALLDRFVDMDVNSYGNLGDFAEVERQGYATRSQLGSLEDDKTVVTRAMRRPDDEPKAATKRKRTAKK